MLSSARRNHIFYFLALFEIHL